MKCLGKMSLLYAEDEVATLKLHKEFFENYFKVVYSAENGQQALDIYKDKKPDVVVLDITMPIIDGFNVAKEIRENDQETQIVLLTARVDKQAWMQAVELNLTTYLEKPITRTPMLEALEKIAKVFIKKSVLKLWYYQDKFYLWDKNKQQLSFGEEIVNLTKKEKKLLELFINSKRYNLSYQQIHTDIWFDEKDKEYSENTIKTLIKGLRDKLPPKAIKNSYGLGYCLNKAF